MRHDSATFCISLHGAMSQYRSRATGDIALGGEVLLVSRTDCTSECTNAVQFTMSGHDPSTADV